MHRTSHAPPFFLVLIALASCPPAQVGCGTGDAENDQSSPPAARVALPEFPFWPNDALVIDEGLMARLAAGHCEGGGDPQSSAAFFLGALPYESIDLLGAGSPGGPSVESLLGNLYVSGYFGGVWLRDALAGPGAVAQGTAQSGSSAIEQLLFESIVEDAGRRVRLSRGGSDEEVLDAARRAVPLLLSLFGYNRGYIEVAVEHPPAGVAPPEDFLVCAEFLDCESASIELSTLARYRPALARLGDPPTAEWTEMASEVERWGVGAVNSGRAVWEAILADAAISEGAYGSLLDLSAGYLLVTEAAVLASMTGWADDKPKTARSAGLIQAGLWVWSEGYFLGLASSAPHGSFPEMVCAPV